MSATSPPAVEGQAIVPGATAITAAGRRTMANLKISPAIQRSLDAFRAALPELLNAKTECQVWVAFSGDRQIAFGPTKAQVYQICLARGLAKGTFIVRMVEPETPDEWEIAHES